MKVSYATRHERLKTCLQNEVIPTCINKQVFVDETLMIEC